MFGLTALLVTSVGLGMAQTLDRQVKVTFSDPVVVGETTLPPGDYTFREVSNHVVQVFDGEDMKAEAAVITIDTENKEPSEETKFVLYKLAGNEDLYVNKMWIQGKATGYEFELPERIKSLERERETSISGIYEDRDDNREQGLK
jgi:hypothetical protein